MSKEELRNKITSLKMIKFQPKRISNCGISTGVHQEAVCVWSHEFLSAKRIAMFPAAHHTVSLHMTGKVNYANTKSGGNDRLVTFAFRARFKSTLDPNTRNMNITAHEQSYNKLKHWNSA
jgi:hypothetical protein